MSRNSAAATLDALIERTQRDQSDASDPETSAWVSANAGTGKTHVLTMRVLRLLLAGTRPEKILCLTYTKAAAAEMSKRVFEKLGEWVVMPEDALEKTLRTLTGRKPEKSEMALARTLFTSAIETPGGLKVQTIHAFAERLLQRFPLEAGIAPGFTILDDSEAKELLREASDGVLRAATRAPHSALGEALKTVIVFAVDDNFDSVLAEAVKQREWLDEAGKVPPTELNEMLRRHFGVRITGDRTTIEGECASLVSDADLRRLHDALSFGSTNDIKLAAAVKLAQSPSPRDRIQGLRGLFLTKDGDERKSFMTAKTKAAVPDLDALLTRAQAQFRSLNEELRGLDIVEATQSLMTIANEVMQRFTAAKSRRGAFDFQDLIDKTRSLLRSSGSAEWVLYKLDHGLSHILVDESQDTAPSQWRIVEALAQEFFSGRGASEEHRTIFAVGDEKQSIYSFQGAAPEMFDRMGTHFQDLITKSGARWHKVPLNLSFRSVEPVLSAVDEVFSDQMRRQDLTTAKDEICHYVKRQGQAGLVEIWPVEVAEAVGASDPWSPIDELMKPSPVLRLASRIADTVKSWLDTGAMLVSEDRPIRAGDILILVRKRRPFAAPMVAALKMRGIPVAGADRMRLTEQIAIQDLLALGEFLTLPEDDLSLASVLKCPMFGLDDDDLIALAAGRRRTLWKSLLDRSKEKESYTFAAGTLKRWRQRADFSPPYEFFASILDKDGMRKRFLARLGPDAADGIDEFLNLALIYDDKAPPSLSGFLRTVRRAEREVKRDMEHGRNEVRVMTVHGAKGLEAPIVFLPDTCSTATAKGQGGGLIELKGLTPPGTPAPFAWSIKGASKHPTIAVANELQRETDRRELNRLLYVAMTRARDRLYVGGFEQGKRRPAGCWYEYVMAALDPAKTATPADGIVFRSETAQMAPHDKNSADAARDLAPLQVPSWASESAPREPQPAIPLAPSRLAPYEYDEAGEPSPVPPPQDTLREPATPLSPAIRDDSARFLRGTLTHALLQHLPAFERRVWKKAADAFLALRGKGISKRVRDSIAGETLRILDDPKFAALFGPGSRAEVPIVASLPRPRGIGPQLKITGQIDRLADTGSEVLIIDYKTNRPPPGDPLKVAEVYLYQLAAYRLAIAEIFQGRTVRAAILWTMTPSIMEIPSSLLDKFAAKLWDVHLDRLDA